MKKFHFYTDAGHGWLRVEREIVIDLGIAGAISHFSYEKGKYLYLEEDRDAIAFMNAYSAAHGRPEIVEHYTARSGIRGYKNFVYTPSVKHAA